MEGEKDEYLAETEAGGHNLISCAAYSQRVVLVQTAPVWLCACARFAHETSLTSVMGLRSQTGPPAVTDAVGDIVVLPRRQRYRTWRRKKNQSINRAIDPSIRKMAMSYNGSPSSHVSINRSINQSVSRSEKWTCHIVPAPVYQSINKLIRNDGWQCHKKKKKGSPVFHA